MYNYYTVKEVATKLDVSMRTVRRYINANMIKATKQKGKYIILKEDLTAFINGDKNPAQPVDHNRIHEDDLCVFMDSATYKTSQTLSVCTIIDIALENKIEAMPIKSKIKAYIKDTAKDDDNTKFEYVYKEREKIARFVVWGSATTIKHIMEIVENDK